MKYNSKIAIFVTIVAIVLIGYLDYRTGFKFSLFPLYLIPLAVMAWNYKLNIALSLSTVAGVTILIKDLAIEGIGMHSLYVYWDIAIKISLLILVSYGICKIKELLLEKTRSNQELKQALDEISELREMIPICAWCHSIRNDKGLYEKVEVYLTRLTGVALTHGICPACTEKFYGHLTEKKENDSTHAN